MARGLVFIRVGPTASPASRRATFDSTVKSLRQIAVDTWLDEPENAVTLKVTMQPMPEGISYPGTIVFALVKRQLEVRITKSNYQKIAQ